MGKKEKVGVIRPEDIKVRRRKAPPVQRHKSPRDYDRKRLKEDIRKEIDNE